MKSLQWFENEKKFFTTFERASQTNSIMTSQALLFLSWRREDITEHFSFRHHLRVNLLRVKSSYRAWIINAFWWC
jgi:hypothetical protein